MIEGRVYMVTYNNRGLYTWWPTIMIEGIVTWLPIIIKGYIHGDL